MSILKSVKAVSRPFATLSLGLLAIASVAAAPKGHTLAAPKRQPAKASASRPERVALDSRRMIPPTHSVKALREHIAFLKKWGRDHKVKVKTGYLEAYLFRMERLAFPNDRVDWQAYKRGYAQRELVPAAHFGPARRSGTAGATALAQRWEYLGPNNLAVPYQIYYGQGVLSGRVNGLAYDPNVSSTYWLAAAGGGVWKTTNSGQSWTFLSQSWPTLETGCIALSPTDGNTAYVGTGDFHGAIALGAGHLSFGVMKTTDGGQTWTNLGKQQFGNVAVSDIIIDPENPQTVIASTGRGLTSRGQVWRSTNGGQSWTPVINAQADWSGLAVGARSGSGSRYFWAIGQGVAGGELWRSADRGATWTKITNSGLRTGIQSGLDIAASRLNADTVYIMSGLDQKIIKSTDAGGAWTDISNGFPSDDTAGDKYNWSQEWYDWHITTSTNGNNDVLYVGLVDLVMSPDGGTTWKTAGGTYGQNALTHNDQHCVAVNPKNPNEILVGNDGGVFRMNYTPSTNSVVFATNLNAGLGITQFYKADYHPTDPNRMLGGTQDNATPVALGDLTRWRNVCGGDGCGCAINPRNPNIQYASSQGQNICRTSDQWTANIQAISPDWGADNLPFIGRIALDPKNPSLLYAGTNYLWRRDDATQTWTARLGGQALASGAFGTVEAIAIAPSDSNIIYTGASTGEIYMSTNAGANWTRLNQSPTNLPLRSVESIAVHPTNPRQILVGLNGTGAAHVWRCADTGQANPTWVNVSGAGTTAVPDTPVNAVVFDPVAPNTRYYIGTDLGVFRSTNAGASWENATAPLNLPNVRVMDLKVAGTGYLMAATYGRGIWRIDPQAAVTRLTVTRPNGGETLVVNQPTTITWDTLGFSAGHQVKIELSRNGGSSFPEVLAASVPDTGSFAWTPQLPVSSACRIRITSLTDVSVSDTSDGDFSVVQGSIAVTAPNGGELVRFNDKVTIKWNATDYALTSPDVMVELSRNGGQSFDEVLFDAVSTASGQVEWKVTGPSTTRARIRVTAVTLPSFSDTSDADFEIRQPSTIEVQRPNGGDRFTSGTPVSLLWNSAGFSGNVRIEISRNGGASWEVLFPDTPNDGAEVWDVVGPATRLGRIRVVSNEEPNVSDQSDGVFSIEMPSIQVTAPAAGKILLQGVPTTVNWTSTGLAASNNVRIELSRDGGNAWSPLQTSTSNSGQYTFTPSGDVSASCRIRVSAVAMTGVSGDSSTFSIAAPTLFLVAPNGGEKWPIGDQRIIEWSGNSVGTGRVSIEVFRNKREGWVPIIEDTPNDGAQAWIVSGALSDKAKIRVVWNSNSAVALQAESRKAFQIVKQKKSKSRSGR